MFQPIETSQAPARCTDDINQSLRLTLSDGDAGGALDLQHALILGSDTDCDLRIDDHHVRGQHAEIYPVGATWWVRDLGTEDGTFLNGEIVEAAPLIRPSEVQLGVDGPTVHVT